MSVNPRAYLTKAGVIGPVANKNLEDTIEDDLGGR